MLKPTKILKINTVYDGWLKLKQAEVLLPNSNRMTYTYAEKSDGVIVLGITEDKKVPVVKQFRVPPQRFFIELPAGLMEDGETPEQTALRELEEESGYKAKSITKLAEIYPTTGIMNFKIHIFFAEKLEKTKQKLDPTEFIETDLMSIEQLEQLVNKGNIDSGVALAFLYAKHKGLI